MSEKFTTHERPAHSELLDKLLNLARPHTVIGDKVYGSLYTAAILDPANELYTYTPHEEDTTLARIIENLSPEKLADLEAIVSELDDLRQLVSYSPENTSHNQARLDTALDQLAKILFS